MGQAVALGVDNGVPLSEKEWLMDGVCLLLVTVSPEVGPDRETSIHLDLKR